MSKTPRSTRAKPRRAEYLDNPVYWLAGFGVRLGGTHDLCPSRCLGAWACGDLSLYPMGASDMRRDVQERFRQIYRHHRWGGCSRSGPGSDAGNNATYLSILQSVIRESDVRSVVDLGCGDWSLAREIDWSGLQYTGIDIVPELQASLNASFGTSTRTFLCADLVEDELPGADLVIVKDVLQHLSNASVLCFLGKLPRYRLALITNDCQRSRRRRFPVILGHRDLIEPNSDIADGGSRPLRLTRAPFNLPARRLAGYDIRLPETTYAKEVLLWSNPQPDHGTP